jgi:ribosomal protein S18 acetylase RimI-like enzyme
LLDRQPSTMIVIKQVTDFSELEEIKNLQEANLKKNLTEEEAALEGFVTAEYTTGFLARLHEFVPSVIAKDGDKVVGYALAASTSIRNEHDLLTDLINNIDKIIYQDQPLKHSRYILVGQLCVARDYRGLGLVHQMYDYFKSRLSNEYDYCITDVAIDNPRSLKAHLKSGFHVIDTLHYGGVTFDIVLWDWKRQ